MTQLSDHFSWEEVTKSTKATLLGINNELPEELRPVILNTAKGMERVRALLGKPINVDSWYRCPALNQAVGSKPTSQHLKGEAVDFISQEFGSPLQICQLITKYPELIRFDQLILEHTWVHISFCSDPATKPRGQVLSLLQTGKYALGLTNTFGESYGTA